MFRTKDEDDEEESEGFHDLHQERGNFWQEPKYTTIKLVDILISIVKDNSFICWVPQLPF